MKAKRGVGRVLLFRLLIAPGQEDVCIDCAIKAMTQPLNVWDLWISVEKD